MTILTCDFNGHIWERDPQRGRPPRYCPLHRPEPAEIKVNVKKDHVKVSVEDIVPGLKNILQQEKIITLYCHAGDHEWQAERKRGRKPRDCPSHSQIGQVVRKQELNKESLEKIRDDLSAQIAVHAERSAAARAVDNIAYENYLENHDSEDAFQNWMKYNSRYMNEVTALRATEGKLAAL